ncbi:MAG TPA: hypothetical protein VNI58_03120 [Mariprofundaceae bacterium]|nr:hypothetical protein [Mariprofundaceae bacterium]
MKHFCEQACRLSSDHYERPLTLSETVKLRLHLLICRACRNYLDTLETLHRAMEQLRRLDMAAWKLSDAQRARISRSLQDN